MIMTKLYRNRKRQKSRMGAATIELAVCIPVMALIVFASLSGSRMLFLRQACVQAAYETAKEGVKANGSEAFALERGNAVLEFRNVSGHTISFDPSNVEDLPRGTPVTVTVTIPSEGNTLFAFGPFAETNLEATATFLKE